MPQDYLKYWVSLLSGKTKVLGLFLKYWMFFLFIKPFIYLVLGVNVSGADNLPKIDRGPYIIIANHNSHIDTMLLMSLFTSFQALKIHPVAAADYFCNTKLKAFFFKKVLGIIPIERKLRKIHEEELFKDINNALKSGHTIVIFPEGTRGEDNTLQKFKSGVAHIAKMNPNVPVVPFYLNGPDKILPKKDFIWVPFICDVYIGEHLYIKPEETTKEFTARTEAAVTKLKEEHKRKEVL